MENWLDKYDNNIPQAQKGKNVPATRQDIIEIEYPEGKSILYDNKKPLYVNSKKDPRYQAYQDSLALYNYTKLQKSIEPPRSRFNSIISSIWPTPRQLLKNLTPVQQKQQGTLTKLASNIVRNSNGRIKFGLAQSNKKDSLPKDTYSVDIFSPTIDYSNLYFGDLNFTNADYSNVKPQQPVIVQETKKPATNIQPKGIQHKETQPKRVQHKQIAPIQSTSTRLATPDFKLEASTDIKVPVRTPKKYKIEDRSNPNAGFGRGYGGTESSYISFDPSKLQHSDNRKITPIYQEGGLVPIVPKTFNTGNPVRDALLRTQDSLKQVARQPKVYSPPKQTIMVATPAQRAYADSIKQINRAKLQQQFERGAATRGLTPEQYSLWLEQNSKQKNVPLDGLSGLPTDGEGCVGSERGEKRKLKKEAKRQDGDSIPTAQNGAYLEKLKKNNPELYKEVQRNNRRTESTNKWNEHFEEEKKKEKAKKWVQNSMQAAYKHPLMQPGYFTPEGALVGAIQGAAKMGPDLYEGKYKDAAMNAMMMLPLAPNAIRAAAPAVQRLGKLMGKTNKVSNELPFPTNEFTLDINNSAASNNIEDLRRAFHRNERFLDIHELSRLNREGFGLRNQYAPDEIRNIYNILEDDLITPEQSRQILDWNNNRGPYNNALEYNSLTDLPLSKVEKLNNLNAGVRARYAANGNRASELYNEQILTNINDTFRQYNRLNPNNRLHPRLSPVEESMFTIQPHNSIDLRRLSRYETQFEQGTYSSPINVEPRNLSGYTKEQTMAMLAKDKADKISKLSPDEFDKIYVTPKGDIVPQTTEYTKPVIHDMSNNDWVESFNSNLPRLNKIIEANNTSGKPYTVSGIDKSGNIKFDSEFGQSYFSTNITPGRFAGEIEDIANYMYMQEIPGVSMANTSMGIFGPGGVHKGTKAYDSINAYLKEMELGRVKAGFNSQTKYSRGLWENAVKNDKAVGYYGRPGTVHSIMKTVVPGAVGLGVLSELDKKQDGGVIEDDRGQWAHPGKVTRINSNRITMRGVDYPVLGVSNTGQKQMMYPNGEYKFDGDFVTEYPMAQNGTFIQKKDSVDDKNILNFKKPTIEKEINTLQNQAKNSKVVVFAEAPTEPTYDIWDDDVQKIPQLQKIAKNYYKVSDAYDKFYHNMENYKKHSDREKIAKAYEQKLDNIQKTFDTSPFNPIKTDSSFIKEGQNVKQFYKRTNPNVNVDVVPMYENLKLMQEKLKGLTQFDKAAIFGHFGSRLAGVKNDSIAKYLNKSKVKDCYFGTCHGEDLVKGIPELVGKDLRRLKNKTLNYRPSEKPWFGFNPDAKTFDEGMWSRNEDFDKDGINTIKITPIKKGKTHIVKKVQSGGEIPVAQNGLRQEQKNLQNLDNLLNFTNYNSPQPSGWLDKY